MNTACVTAGMIVEKVTGRLHACNLRDRITVPLGLRRAYYPGDDPRLPSPAARGYLDVDGENQSIPATAAAS